VTCPVALYPATSDTEKVSFNQIKPQDRPSHQICTKVDADTGRGSRRRRHHEGLQVDTDTYIEVSKDELEGHRVGVDAHHRDRRVRAESTSTIAI